MDLEELHCARSYEAIEIAANGKDKDARVKDEAAHPRESLEDAELDDEHEGAESDLCADACGHREQSWLLWWAEHVIFDPLPADMLSGVALNLEPASHPSTLVVLLAHRSMRATLAVATGQQGEIARD